MINPFAETFMVATRTRRSGLPDMHADLRARDYRPRPRILAARRPGTNRLMRLFRIRARRDARSL